MVTAGTSPQLLQNGTQWQRDVDRCRAGIASAEQFLRGGHPDVAGLCLALSDWSAELRVLMERSWKNESSSI
jgi:hypothetical protein